MPTWTHLRTIAQIQDGFGSSIVQAEPSNWQAYKYLVQALPLGFLRKIKKYLILWTFLESSKLHSQESPINPTYVPNQQSYNWDQLQ